MNIAELNESQRRRFYFEKHFIDELKKIDKFNTDLKIDNFSILLYHFVNFDSVYPKKCKICDNSPKFISFNKGYNTFCSKRCVMSDKDIVISRNEKSKETCLKKWGVDNVMKSDVVKKLQKDSALAKWGVDSYTKTSEYKENQIRKNLDKYGVPHYLQTVEFKEKSKETNISKRGVSHHMKDNNFIDNFKKINIEKWGVSCFSKTDEFKEKMKIYFNSIEFEMNIENQNKKRKELEFNFYKNYIENDLISIEDGILNYKCLDCENTFAISKQLLYLRNRKDRLICTNCNPKNGNNISMSEKDVLEFIRNNYKGEIIENYKDKYEIDIYLPDINSGFEYNGLWFHSTNFKGKYYHQEKSLYFKERNISVFNIWEDDWLYRREIVESMIRYKIGNISHRVGARKCDIREINDNKKIKDFLNKNHLQGYCPSSINIGLFFDDDLVSLMTIGKSRNKKNEIELLRFCNKVGFVIIGGFTKLVKCLFEVYQVDKLSTYSDMSHSDGTLYSNNGFSFIQKTDPGYYWCKNGIKYNRFRFRKSNLIKEGFDKNKTEDNIMLERGFYKLYNCGNYKFEIKNPNFKSDFL